MKILHLINRFDYCDGCARHVFFLAQRQRTNGHDVMVVAGKGNALDMLTGEKIAVREMRLLAHEERSIPNMIIGAAQVLAIIRRFQPDIVHSHHFYAANLVAMVSRFASIKTVLTVHSNLPAKGILPKYVGDRIIAVSNSTKQNILSHAGALRSTITVIPNGSEALTVPDGLEGMPAYRRLKEMKAQKFVITFVGRIVEIKGLHILLRALRSLKRKIPVLCVIVGTGEFEEVIQQQIRDDSLDALWFGSIPNVRPVLDLSDLIVIPSLAQEGLPMLLLEAGLAGRAVVASSTDGITEVIEDHTTGILVAPGDVEGLIQAIQTLYEQADMRASLGAAIQSKVMEQYSVDKMTASVDAVYRSLM